MGKNLLLSLCLALPLAALFSRLGYSRGIHRARTEDICASGLYNMLLLMDMRENLEKIPEDIQRQCQIRPHRSDVQIWRVEQEIEANPEVFEKVLDNLDPVSREKVEEKVAKAKTLSESIGKSLVPLKVTLP